jgi:hypothetical protein
MFVAKHPTAVAARPFFDFKTYAIASGVAPSFHTSKYDHGISALNRRASYCLPTRTPYEKSVHHDTTPLCLKAVTSHGLLNHTA